MLFIDAHLDLAWNALQWNRDLTCSALTIRAQEAHVTGFGRALNTVAFPEMRSGKVCLSFATLLSRNTGTPSPHIDYATKQQAYAIAKGQLAYYRALENDRIARLITNKTQLQQHIQEWETVESGSQISSPPLGFIISMESADPILSPSNVSEWFEEGVRMIGMSHYGHGRYSGGTGVESNLNNEGLALLQEMIHVGILIDMTHFSDQAFWQVLELHEGPVHASHNNCRTLVPHQRQFSDNQLKAIIERDGVIGVAFDCWMLNPGWITGHTSNRGITLQTVTDHIDYICQLAGNAGHVGIGSDLDGGFGKDQSPSDLDTIADLQNLIPNLQTRGYSEEDIKKICYRNWLRYTYHNLPEE